MPAKRKMTAADVADARRRIAAGQSLRSVAREMGYDKHTVSRRIAAVSGASGPSMTQTSGPIAKASPEGASERRVAFLFRSAARLEALMAGADAMEAARLSSELRAVHAELVQADLAARAEREAAGRTSEVTAKVRERLARLAASSLQLVTETTTTRETDRAAG